MTASSYRTAGPERAPSTSPAPGFERPAGQVVFVDFGRRARTEMGFDDHDGPSRNVLFGMVFVAFLTALAVYVFQSLVSIPVLPN